ncbi:MAG: hypothetical protein EBX19_06930 [Actinobacteria bacterium]|nr:hypothetical protein [Actinomycetota bacterium]
MMMALSVRADEPAKSEPAPVREFRGETEKESTGPFNTRPIFTVSDYEAAWKELGLTQSPGEVDFQKEFVLLATTRGSRVGFRCRDEGDGKLNVSAMSTRDIRPGLRYLIGVFLKKDWKEVNGTPIR